MSTLLENLKKYFAETPREQVERDWAESRKFDKVGVTVKEFIENSKKITLVLFFCCSFLFCGEIKAETPCEYENCEEVEGDDLLPPASINGWQGIVAGLTMAAFLAMILDDNDINP